MNKLLFLIAWIGVSQSIFVLGQSDTGRKKIDSTENKKIEFLLNEISQQKGARFWRNGTWYTTEQATEYLRMKLRWNDNTGKVRNAREFIERVASKSAITGKPYQIQLQDGKKIEMKTFLYQKLSEWKE